MRQAQQEVKSLEPLVTRYFPVSYSDAGKEVIPHIELILTKDRGSVSVDSKNNQSHYHGYSRCGQTGRRDYSSN